MPDDQNAQGLIHFVNQIVESDGGCWQWLGRTDADGYGRARGGQMAHRVSYEHFGGPIPDGLELDHLCRNPSCLNPDHMEPVTHAENVRRSIAAQKTHCVNGHSYDEENTYIRSNGTRDCRACHRERARNDKAGAAARQRAYRARKKAREALA